MTTARRLVVILALGLLAPLIVATEVWACGDSVFDDCFNDVREPISSYCRDPRSWLCPRHLEIRAAP